MAQSGESRISLRSFDLCQSAATHISTLGKDALSFLVFSMLMHSITAARFKASYSLSTSCAFAPSYLLTAG